MSEVFEVFYTLWRYIVSAFDVMHPSLKTLFAVALVGHAVVLPVMWILRRFFFQHD